MIVRDPHKASQQLEIFQSCRLRIEDSDQVVGIQGKA